MNELENLDDCFRLLGRYFPDNWEILTSVAVLH